MKALAQIVLLAAAITLLVTYQSCGKLPTSSPSKSDDEDGAGTTESTVDSGTGTGTGNATDVNTNTSTATGTGASITDPKCFAAASGVVIATYEDFMDHLNGLVEAVGEVDTACLIASLPRPLRVNATTSDLSVQPANGKRNPRLFVVVGTTDTVVLGLGVSGKSAESIEFSVLADNDQSIKGEILLPLKSPLDANAPFARARASGTEGTTCKACHGAETPAPSAFGTDARLSKALRPMPHSDVPLSDLEDVKGNQVLEALFHGGPPERYDFPESMSTLF